MKVRKYRIEMQVRINHGLGFEPWADSEPLVSSFDWELIKEEWYKLRDFYHEEDLIKERDADFHKKYTCYFLTSYVIDDEDEDYEEDYEEIDYIMVRK